MDRKEQILEVATKLVQTRGYSAFSCQDLSARLGITKASIHHHFPSKEDLGIAVAEKYRADVEAALAEAKRTSDDPHVQLDGYLQVVLEIIKTEDRICAVGSVQSDSNVVPATMGTSMCSLAPHVIGWIADVITAGQKRGVMDFPGTPAHHAAPIFSAAQGAMQDGRANGKQKARQVVEQIKKILEPREQLFVWQQYLSTSR